MDKKSISPSISSVRVFEAAARHMNFTHAAQELGTSQAAVSYQIRALERHLGTALFLRAPRKLTLTESGARLAVPVREAFDRLRSAFESFAELGQTVLSLSVAQSFAANWLVPRLGSFQLKHASIAVRLDASDRIIDFIHEEMDIGIRSGDGNWPGLEAVHLFGLELSPVCTPALLKQFAPVARAADLIRLPLISASSSSWKEWFSVAGHPDVDLESMRGPGFLVQHLEGRAALAGQGVAIVNPLFFADELQSGRLVRPIDLTVSTDKSYWLTYPRQRRNAAKIRAFCEWIQTQLPTTQKIARKARQERASGN